MKRRVATHDRANRHREVPRLNEGVLWLERVDWTGLLAQ
jgi:hypothetical protein